MKTLFFVESVKFSCISLVEKLHVTFDGMKGITGHRFVLLKTNLLNKSFEQVLFAAESPIAAVRRSFFGKIICSKKKRQVF